MASKTRILCSARNNSICRPPRTLIHPHRTYYTPSRPPPPGPFTPTESIILSHSAKHIPTHGFTTTSLSLGLKDAGYIDASTNLFSQGALALVHHHLLTQREGLKGRVKDLEFRGQNGKELGVGGKVRALTWERLMVNKDIIHRWQEALALLAQPTNLPTALHELSLLSDEIWYLSGDVSVDTSWYTKRASLAMVYSATELFMTTDTSSGFVETKEFLDRRLSDVRSFGETVSGIGTWVGWTAKAGINVLRSKGVRI